MLLVEKKKPFIQYKPGQSANSERTSLRSRRVFSVLIAGLLAWPHDAIRVFLQFWCELSSA